jgi:hypothetical protein
MSEAVRRDMLEIILCKELAHPIIDRVRVDGLPGRLDK